MLLHTRLVPIFFLYSFMVAGEINEKDWFALIILLRLNHRVPRCQLQVNVTVAIANWEGVSRKASARDNRKGLK
jgi:hypothetical protein